MTSSYHESSADEMMVRRATFVLAEYAARRQELWPFPGEAPDMRSVLGTLLVDLCSLSAPLGVTISVTDQGDAYEVSVRTPDTLDPTVTGDQLAEEASAFLAQFGE